MPPATTRSRPPRRPLRGTFWLGARLTLALRRSRRFVRWWLAIGGAATVVAVLIPVAMGNPQAELSQTAERAAADTLRSATALTRARARAAAADSTLAAALGMPNADGEVAPVEPATISPRGSLMRALDEARTAGGRAAILALAAEPTVASGPRMRATADSFRLATSVQETARLAGVIVALAEYRLQNLEEPPAQTAPTRRASLAPTMDTASLAEIVRAERDTVVIAERAHQAAVAALESANEALAAARTRVPLVSPGLAMIALVILGLFVRIGVALLRELGEPRIAHPLEAERTAGAPVLSLVRDAVPEGPLRFRASGVDPFRVLYLQLTSTGTRTRAVIVTGEDASIVAVVGARLAIAAAADHRTTLVAECDPDQVALARAFRDHPEPGVSDAIAGAFTWREVARNVGSNDGLSIAMLPAGTARGVPDPAERDAALRDFERFREGFEFAIVAVALKDLAKARALLPNAPTVLCATIGETPVAELERAVDLVETSAEPVHSLVLWEAPRPELPSRAELAAWLSKRKSRTPGGSSAAVQGAIRKLS